MTGINCHHWGTSHPSHPAFPNTKMVIKPQNSPFLLGKIPTPLGVQRGMSEAQAVLLQSTSPQGARLTHLLDFLAALKNCLGILLLLCVQFIHCCGSHVFWANRFLKSKGNLWSRGSLHSCKTEGSLAT